MKNRLDVRDNSGITLIALITTIIILLILAGVATYSGIKAIESTKYTKFVAELKIMQTYVNDWYEKNKDGKNVLEDNNIDKVSFSDEQAMTALDGASQEKEIDSAQYADYYVIDDGAKEKLGVEGVSQTVLVNINTRRVVSYLGLNYQNNQYWTLEKLNEFYNVEYTNKNASGDMDFSIKSEVVKQGQAKVTVYDIQYDGYNENWQVKYRKNDDSNWKTSDKLDFLVNESGIYDIQLINEVGNIIGTQTKPVTVTTIMPIYVGLYTNGDNSDLELVFSSTERIDTSNRTRQTLYAGPWEISQNPFENNEDKPWNDYNTQITVATFEDKIQPQYTARWFAHCSNLETINNMKENLDTRNVTTMRGMFHNCSGLTELDVSGFDTKNVTDMSYMFNISTDDPSGRKWSALPYLDLTNWDTSKVENMDFFLESMRYVNAEITIRGNVTTYQEMLGDCAYLGGGVVLNYTSATESIVDGMLETNLANGNITKGRLVE